MVAEGRIGGTPLLRWAMGAASGYCSITISPSEIQISISHRCSKQKIAVWANWRFKDRFSFPVLESEV